MLKKRLIFTLLLEDNKFILSRNFRRQKVGDIHWLHKNYNFSKISFYIDSVQFFLAKAKNLASPERWIWAVFRPRLVVVS